MDKIRQLINQLCLNDISIGLPAEIKMRRRQYEYYRNKLLNFKEYE
jgi:type I restriction enzyme S subunit